MPRDTERSCRPLVPLILIAMAFIVGVMLLVRQAASEDSATQPMPAERGASDRDNDGRISIDEFVGGFGETPDEAPQPQIIDPATSKLYKLTPGPHEIVSETLGIQARAEAALPIRVTFPKEPGRYPVIIFSHGMLGSRDNYQPLIRHWASHGYVCIQPSHEDSRDRIDRAQRRDMRKLMRVWNRRPLDVSLVIDELASLEQVVPGLKNRIDPEHIGVGGHSFGAHTTMLVGGATFRLFGGRRSDIADRRPDALLVLSPQGTSRLFDEQSFADIARPALFVTGTNDRSPINGKAADWRLEAWRHSRGEQHWLGFIHDAYHNFGGISGSRHRGSGPDWPDHVHYVRAISTAFWDAILKNDKAARQFLGGDTLRNESKGAAILTTNRNININGD